MNENTARDHYHGRLSGVVASTLGFLMVALVLAAPGEAVMRDAFFLPPVTGGSSDIRQTSWKLEMSADGRHFLDLQSLMPGPLVASEHLIFKVAVPPGGVSIAGARLVLTEPATGGVAAIFTADSQQLRRGEQRLVLFRNDRSGAMEHQGPLVGRMEIEGATQVLALSAGVAPDRPPTELLFFAAGGSFVSPDGWFESSAAAPVPSRAELLAHTWGWSGVFPVYAFLVGAALLWVGGVLSLTGSGLQPAVGAGLMFLAATTAWSVLMPPFHGPDESDHLLSFAALVGRPALADDALVLANRGHFERIKLRSEEKFTASDMGNPRSDAWAPHVIPEGEGRSPLAALLWSAQGLLVRGDGAASTLLALRLLGGALVAAALVLALMAAAAVMRVNVYWLAAPALLIPSLSFWSAMVSNYALLITGYLWQSVALGILWFLLAPSTKANGARRSLVLVGLLAGSGCGLAVSSGDNGLLSCVFWMVAVPAWLFASAWQGGVSCRTWRQCLLLPATWSAALLTVFMIVGALSANGQFLPARFLEVLRAQSNADALLPVLAAAWLLWVFLLCPFIAQLGRRWQSSPRWRDVRIGLAVLWVILALMATVGGWPRMPDIEQPENSLAFSEYIGRAVHAFVQGFGAIRADWFVVNSFWGWFGWLDAPVPQVFTISLRILFVVGLVLLLTRSLLYPDFPSANVFLLLCTFSILGVVALTAAACHEWGVNLHGRYLIAPYLLTCMIGMEGYRRFWMSSLKDPALAATILVVLASLVQSLTWAFVLPRYF
jgi:hypothetical protein